MRDICLQMAMNEADFFIHQAEQYLDEKFGVGYSKKNFDAVLRLSQIYMLSSANSMQIASRMNQNTY